MVSKSKTKVQKKNEAASREARPKKLKKSFYFKELAKLQLELVRLQEWIKAKGLRVVVLFEGRDAAGKGGVIKRITQCLNPRICRVVALGTPTDKEKSQWYFQRYVNQLPAAGEMVLFDRSWYNRAGVERVMGFCTDAEYRDFLKACPEFEHMLMRSGIILIKYWFSVSDEEQEKRFKARIDDPMKRWKLSPMDVTARSRWVDYSKAKDKMFAVCDTKESPWYVVNADSKKSRAPELHPPSAGPDFLQGFDAQTHQAAAAAEAQGLPAAAVRPALRSGSVLAWIIHATIPAHLLCCAGVRSMSIQLHPPTSGEVGTSGPDLSRE